MGGAAELRKGASRKGVLRTLGHYVLGRSGVALGYRGKGDIARVQDGGRLRPVFCMGCMAC